MSYTKYTWQNDETITAEKLNHMEDGIANAYNSGGTSGKVARLIVNFNVEPAIEGTLCFYIAYAQQQDSTIYGENTYSIESPMTEYWGFNAPYTAKFYVPVCLTDDEFKPCVLFQSGLDNIANYTITGNISHDKISAHEKIGASAWSSAFYYGFEIMGDGQIDIRYYD